MNREPFEVGEFYHIYNHAVENRNIFGDEYDSQRFLDSIRVFNTLEPVGALFLENNINRGETPETKLVNVLSYCLNPNHIHLLLEEVHSGGISEFMKRVGGGYTVYFNNKYKRKGSLFRGVFKSVWVSTDAYLLYLSAYINLNFKVHDLSEELLPLVRSSWNEYSSGKKKQISHTEPILKHFKNKEAYIKYSEESLILMLEKKNSDKQLRYLAID